MLEVKDLKKVYKTPKGAPVYALDGVPLRFPETGMVFLLGNTFIGLIFREYNILNEFSVEDNIALALELQRKPSGLCKVSNTGRLPRGLPVKYKKYLHFLIFMI